MDVRLTGRFNDFNFVSQQAAFDPDLHVEDPAIAQQNAVFHFRVSDDRVVPDGREGSNVAVLDRTVLSDNGGTPDDAAQDPRAGLENDLAGDGRRGVHFAFDARLDIVEHQAIRFQQVGRFARIFPPPGDFAVTDLQPLVDEVLVRIGNFKLAAFARFDPTHGFKNILIVNVDSRHGELTLWLFRFFFDTHDLAVPDLRDAKPFRVFHFGQRKETIAAAFLEVVDESFYSTDHHVVAKIEDEIFFADELLRDFNDMRQAERGRLGDVGYLCSPLLAVPDGLGDFVAVGIVDDADLSNARLDRCLDGVMENRFICDRDEMFVLCVRQGPQPCAATAAGNKSLQCFPLELCLIGEV